MNSTMKHLTITLEHDIDEQYQYQPGEIIRGNISVTLSQPALLKSITISILGEGLVCWEDNFTGQNQAKEIYMNASQLIVDTRNHEPLRLAAGNYDFPFHYQLEENLPSSYIGKFGSVTYVLKATAIGEKHGDSIICSEPFLVVRPAPLQEYLLVSSQKHTQKKVCGLCSFGRITASVKINKTGFIPGEDILIETEVTNRSSQYVVAMQASLIMISIFHAQKQVKYFRQIVNKRRDEYELSQGEGRRWKNVRLAVPRYVPESKLEYCDLIEVYYVFRFQVERSKGNGITLEVPVSVGTKPLGLEIPSNDEAKDIAKLENNKWAIRGLGIGEDFKRDDDLDSEINQKTNLSHVGIASISKEERKMVNPVFEKEDYEQLEIFQITHL